MSAGSSPRGSRGVSPRTSSGGVPPPGAPATPSGVSCSCFAAPPAQNALSDGAEVDKLCSKALALEVAGKHELAAVLWGKGEALARDHAPQGSFIPSLLALRKASALEAQAHAGGLPPDEVKELEEEAWEITSGELPKLIARSDAGTLLPKTCTSDETAFFTRYTVARRAARGKPRLPGRGLRLLSNSCVYGSALDAAYSALKRIYAPPRLRFGDEEVAMSLVSKVAAAVLPASKTLGAGTLAEEYRFAALLNRTLASPSDPFLVGLAALWCSAGVKAMRMKRNLMSDTPPKASRDALPEREDAGGRLEGVAEAEHE